MNKKVTSRLASQLPSFRELMLSENLLSSAQALDIDKLCSESGINFATALMFKGYCSHQKLAELLEARFSVHYFPIKTIPSLGKVKNLISEEKAKELQVFPLTLIEESGQKVLLLGMTDPLDLSAIRKIEFLTHLKVQPAFLPLDDMQALYMKYFRRGLEIFPVEVTFYGEKASGNRARAIGDSGMTEAQNLGGEKLRLIALINLLIKKGLLTAQELEVEMKRISTPA
ncbi:hypothetical protein EBR03_07800 [bacterium]|nr:hypothetical protein [bacterium]